MTDENKTEVKNRGRERIVNIFLMRYFRLIIIAVCILLIAASYLYLIKPKYSKISEIETKSKENNEAIRNDLASYYLQLEKYSQSYEKIDQEIVDKINIMLPENSKSEELLSQIEDIVRNRALSLSSIEIEVDETKSSASNIKAGANKDAKGSLPANVGIMKIKLEVLGVNYEKLKNLLSSLENNLRLMDIENLEFSPTDRKASFEISTYYYKNN